MFRLTRFLVVLHMRLQALRRRVALPASVAVVIRLVNVARSVVLQSVHFQLLGREESFDARLAWVVPPVVVCSLDMRREFVSQIEFLAAEAL